MQDDSEATKVFVLGLLGLLVCQILSPIAWSMGNDYVNTCSMTGQTPNGLGVAGRIMGMVGTALLGLTLVMMCVAFGMVFATGPGRY